MLSDLKHKTEDLGIEKIIDVFLENRGIRTKKEKVEFLNPKLDAISLKSTGIDPLEVRKTVKRIEWAIKENEKIIIYGDYDVDGICGTAILWETIYASYKNVIPYIPHRVDEGYGLSISGIDQIAENITEKGLIITVDNGIVANKAVAYAKEKGFDVIITDHHVASEKKPKAFSIVHTTQLCGTGVAFLLSKELKTKDLRLKTDEHLELVALATVADLVPLVNANRALVKFGIESLRKTKRPGLLALFTEAQIKKDQIGVYEIGHIIAPRLNASGRIAHAMDSLRLICTKDLVRAKNLAAELAQTNRSRQSLTTEATTHADSITKIDGKIIFVAHEQYDQGIIGLVASRLVEKHYRPSIVVSIGEQISKGSARSVRGFNIIEFLRKFDVHLIDAGGHPMAAGFTLETVKIEQFQKALMDGSKKAIADELLERVLEIDMEIPFDLVSSDLYKSIQMLSPFGMGNFEPIFSSSKVKIEAARFVGADKKHLKLSLSQDGKSIDAIFFGGAEYGLKIGETIDIVYTIENDSWNGNQRLQLKIRDALVG